MKINILFSLKTLLIAIAYLIIFTSCENSFLGEQDPIPIESPLENEQNEINTSSFDQGSRGGIYIRYSDGSMGPAIPNAKITFKKTDGSYTKTVYSQFNGRYEVLLPAGSYNTLVTHNNFDINKSFIIVPANQGFKTSNFFLKELNYGFNCATYHVNFNNTTGPRLPYVKVIFTKDDGNFTKTIWTDHTGFRKVKLPVGRYYVTYSKPGYKTYNTYPGFRVVMEETGYLNYNMYLKEPLIYFPQP